MLVGIASSQLFGLRTSRKFYSVGCVFTTAMVFDGAYGNIYEFAYIIEEKIS